MEVIANEVKQSHEIAASLAPRNDYFLKPFIIKSETAAFSWCNGAMAKCMETDKYDQRLLEGIGSRPYG